MATSRITRAAEAKTEAALTYSLDRYGNEAAARYRALIYQAIHDFAVDWETLMRRGLARSRDGLLVYPLRARRRNVPRSVGMVGNPSGFIVGRIDEGRLVILTFVGEGMLNANVTREARASEAEDQRQE